MDLDSCEFCVPCTFSFMSAMILTVGDDIVVRAACQCQKFPPNPPISGERLGFWTTPQGICAERTRLDGMRGAVTVCVEGRRRLRLCRVKDEDTPGRFSKRGQKIR